MESRLSRLFDNPGTLLAILVAVMISLGSVMVYSASGARAGLENIRVQAQRDSRPEEEYRFHHGTDYFVKQVAWVAIGLLIGGVILKVPVELYEKYAPAILIASFVVLILVLTPLGLESKGAKRWIRLGPLSVQPSEFAKICLVIFMARLMADKREKMRVFRDGLLPTLGVLGCFGLHVSPRVSSGKIGLRDGETMAAVASIHGTVRGRGGHAAAPHETIDPMPAAAACVLALQQIVSRRIPPTEMAVVSVTQISGGTTTNVIPLSLIHI